MLANIHTANIHTANIHTAHSVLDYWHWVVHGVRLRNVPR